MLRTMDEAYKIQQLLGERLNPLESYYMMTLGNAQSLVAGRQDRHAGSRQRRRHRRPERRRDPGHGAQDGRGEDPARRALPAADDGRRPGHRGDLRRGRGGEKHYLGDRDQGVGARSTKNLLRRPPILATIRQPLTIDTTLQPAAWSEHCATKSLQILALVFRLLATPLAFPAPAQAVTININIGTNLNNGRPITCREGEWRLRNRGFRDVRRVDCRGRIFLCTAHGAATKGLR